MLLLIQGLRKEEFIEFKNNLHFSTAAGFTKDSVFLFFYTSSW